MDKPKGSTVLRCQKVGLGQRPGLPMAVPEQGAGRHPPIGYTGTGYPSGNIQFLWRVLNTFLQWMKINKLNNLGGKKILQWHLGVK